MIYFDKQNDIKFQYADQKIIEDLKKKNCLKWDLKWITSQISKDRRFPIKKGL